MGRLSGSFLALAGAICTPVLAHAQSEGFGINCAIRPLQIVEIAAPLPGIVSEVFVRPGTTVAAGDVIARFDAEVSTAILAAAELRANATAGRDSAQAQRDALAAKVTRLQRGVERRAVSQSELDAARLELTVAEGTLSRENEQLLIAKQDVAEARIAIEKSTVRSPVAGQIGEDLIDVGESPQGRHVAIVYVTEPLRVEAYVPTTQLAKFLAKSDFGIVVNNDRTNPIPVSLDYVSQVADLSSNTQSVYFTLSAEDILPGYQCLFPADMN